MSIALEKALTDLQAEGGHFKTRDGKIVGIRPEGFKASPGLKDRLLLLGKELEAYFEENNSVIRCFQCEKSDLCQDGTDCRYPPPGIGSPG